MSALDSYLVDPNDNDFTAVLKDTENSSKKILGLIESLGPSLTSLDRGMRCNATRLLAEVISQSQTLSSDDMVPLTEFFCDRIKDHHSIVPHVLIAFSSLTSNTSLADNCAVITARAIFKHAEVQTMTQQHRSIAFQTISNLLTNKLDVLVMMKEEFTLGYIHMIDGEKDPRNLLTVFQLTPIVVSNFPIGVCAEDVFDVTACYFPVDFTPPPGDAFQITRQQLADQLRVAMTSTPKFSAFCLPLLIEKISSDLQSAKQDSFETLTACCTVYSVEHLRPYMNTLTQLALREAMLSPSSKTEELALQAITALASCLAAPSDGVIMYTDVDEYCKALLKDCKHHLFEPEHKLVIPSVKILQRLVSSNHHVANTVLSDVLPQILEQINSSPEQRKKHIYIDMVARLMGSSYGDVSAHKQLALATIVSHMSHESEVVAAASIQCMCTLSDSLADSLDTICYQLLDIASGSSSQTLRDEASQCLAVFLKDSTSDRTQSILAPICQRLASVSNLQLSSLQTLNIIARHCGSDKCMPALQPMLDCCMQCCGERPEMFAPCLESLRHLVSSLTVQLEDNYLRQCMHILTGASSLQITENVLQSVQDIVIDLVNHTSERSLKDIASSAAQTTNWHPLASSAIQSLLCTLPSQFVDERKLLEMFAPFSVDKSSSVSQLRTDSCKICASLINKSQNPDVLLDYLFPGGCPPSTVDSSHLLLCIWVTKALILRGHRLSQQFLLQIIKWLTEPELSPGAAAGLDIILKDSTEVLSKRQHAAVRVMYKQRVFMTAFPLLHDMFSNIQPGLVANVHIAVTNLIRHVPRQVISNDKQMLLAVLVKLLSSEDAQVLLRTLEVMADDSDNGLLGQHVDTLLPVLLRLSRYAYNMRVRMASLQCLATLSKLNITLLVPHMNDVIKQLLPALDDRKRLVRREAVKTRNLWCMVRDGK